MNLKQNNWDTGIDFRHLSVPVFVWNHGQIFRIFYCFIVKCVDTEGFHVIQCSHTVVGEPNGEDRTDV